MRLEPFDNGCFNIKAHGADASISDNTGAIQACIDAASVTGGGRVVVPPGEFRCGTLHLRDGVELHLARGAVLQAIERADAFPAIPPAEPSRMDEHAAKAYIYATHCRDVAVTGSGCIECGGDAADFATGLSNDPRRPYGLHFVACQGVRVEDVNLRNAAFWMLRLFHCDQVKVRGVTIFNHCNLNNDGLDLDGCRDAIVSDCAIDSSDDALCIKSEGARESRDVVVVNCLLSSHASAIKIGTGSIGGFRRVVVSNCVVHPSRSEHSFHERGMLSGLGGINLATVDGGAMEDVVVSGIHIHGVESPIFVRLGQRLNRRLNIKDGRAPEYPWHDAPEKVPGVASGITLRDITAEGCGPVASSITACEGSWLERVRLSNIRLRPTRIPAGVADATVSDLPTSYPKPAMFGTDLPACGLFVRGVRDLIVDDLQVDAPEGDNRPALVLERVSDVLLRRLRGLCHALEGRVRQGPGCVDLSVEQ
ncbi:MAG: glycoside hydrolase family 28 protein [Verrucomicrobiota bacterium]